MTHNTTNNRKYCSQCASILIKKCPDGDTCERSVCEDCGHIDYDNPKVLVACFATFENKLLWMRRKYEPMAGYWFIPAGFMELGETPEEATSRELFEETCAVIPPENLNFFMIGSLPDISQIYLAYRGEIADIKAIQTTDESLETCLFTEDEAPLDKLAFPTVIETFHLFYKEHRESNYGAHKASVVNNKHILSPLASKAKPKQAHPK
jgi:ADP-ribose pyrophosphatase YjhB (NUDIX family)